jgi:hypothetical protein
MICWWSHNIGIPAFLVAKIRSLRDLQDDSHIAETGADMSLFPSARHLASWAGVSPGSNESARPDQVDKDPSGQPVLTGPREQISWINRSGSGQYLKNALGVSAMSAARLKNTFFAAKYQRIRARRGPMRALVAVEHALIITAWNLLTDGAFYREIGPDYYTVRKPAKAKARAINQLEALGYTVTLKPLADC